jgi:hypothetical protein
MREGLVNRREPGVTPRWELYRYIFGIDGEGEGIRPERKKYPYVCQ